MVLGVLVCLSELVLLVATDCFSKLTHTDLYLNTLIPTQHLKLTNTLIEKAQNEWKLQLETTPELSVPWEYALYHLTLTLTVGWAKGSIQIHNTQNTQKNEL